MGTLPKNGQVSVEVDATPEQVWNLLTDITRAGEWSHETQGGEWLDGADGPAVGARFRGRNENGRMKWTPPVRGARGRRATARSAGAPSRPSCSTGTAPSGPTSSSRPTRGCRITQRFEVVDARPDDGPALLRHHPRAPRPLRRPRRRRPSPRRARRDARRAAGRRLSPSTSDRRSSRGGCRRGRRAGRSRRRCARTPAGPTSWRRARTTAPPAAGATGRGRRCASTSSVRSVTFW